MKPQPHGHTNHRYRQGHMNHRYRQGHTNPRYRQGHTNPRYRQGVTLLELLVVITIIGVLAAVGFVNLQASIRAQQLREVQVQFAQTVERARGLSRRYGYTYEVRMHPSKATAPTRNFWFEAVPQQQSTNYALAKTATANTTKTTPTDAPTLTFDLPKGLKITNLSVLTIDPIALEWTTATSLHG
jgi:prepilin-type N-terminal cleavage/methylation domain-containing protein